MIRRETASASSSHAILVESLSLIAGRLRRPRLNGPLEWRSILGAYGLHHLPIAFDPAF